MIRKWILKAIVQKTIAYLPYSQRINYFFQKHVTRGVFLSDEYFEDRLQHARKHIEAWQKYGAKNPPGKTLELGTGWYPVVPISLFLFGAEEIRTVDVTLLTNVQHVLKTIEKFLDYEAEGKLQEYLSCQPERLERLRVLASKKGKITFEDLTKELRIRYLVQDARRLSIDTDSIDLIHSNNTFEHIYPDILKAILQDFKRVVKPGGLQSHFIDLSDHFAHFDKSITIYNFLRFSPVAWRWIDNTVQPLNRMRITDYRKLYKEVGLEITEEQLRPGDLKALESVPVHASFLENTAAENAVSHGYFFSKMR